MLCCLLRSEICVPLFVFADSDWRVANGAPKRAATKQTNRNGCPVPKSGTRRYKDRGQVKGAQLKLAATNSKATSKSARRSGALIRG
jgi:hypothetical protein